MLTRWRSRPGVRVKGCRLVNKGSAVRRDKTAIDFDICPKGSEDWIKRSCEITAGA